VTTRFEETRALKRKLAELRDLWPDMTAHPAVATPADECGLIRCL
jgi:hypothetical protein